MPAEAIYRSRAINRSRRTQAEMGAIKRGLFDVLAVDRPMTVRQVFYRAVSAGLVDKTETEYKGTVVRLLAELRRSGQLPFEWIADNTRWMRKPRTWSSLEQALQNTAATYRRALWESQWVNVEVWLEKDALAGVLYDVTERWDVPLMVTRGYPSLTFLHAAAEAIEASRKPTFIYYFGDHDPSGVHIPVKVEEELRRFASGVPLIFERVAVTPAQIVTWDLPTRPTKRSDSRAKHFVGESVEVDAIPPAELRTLVEDCIERHIRTDLLRPLQVAEEEERRILLRIAGNAA